MIEIINNDINSIFYEINKKYIIPKFKNLKDNEIKFKNKKDIVTTVDISIEKYLEKKLKKSYPIHYLLAKNCTILILISLIFIIQMNYVGPLILLMEQEIL